MNLGQPQQCSCSGSQKAAPAEEPRYAFHFTLDKTYAMPYRKYNKNFNDFEVYHAHLNSD